MPAFFPFATSGLGYQVLEFARGLGTLASWSYATSKLPDPSDLLVEFRTSVYDQIGSNQRVQNFAQGKASPGAIVAYRLRPQSGAYRLFKTNLEGPLRVESGPPD
jgi:hypothetical protein